MDLFDVIFFALWGAVAPVAVWYIYHSQKNSMPWQWFQGQTKARIIVTSIVFGLLWPSVLLLTGLCAIPSVHRWIVAFIRWEKPAPRHQQPFNGPQQGWHE
ncbi:hypothetical protein [Amycolatopsis sp. H20-H5]|uniref:hypothetical protein n=1 Tax=Amycolatopsis sp. H20-H5 TaxID=3046309 RepID=UPI002DBECEC2|nr:hypothetical protein [Amycolatopsis sp. H20-H5]MEC3980861.1 hypothetical protein [Amycolatopsis sp. H20-H5]